MSGGLPLRGPHRDTIAGLIAAAAWLSQHPELPETRATVHVGAYNLDRDQMQKVGLAMDQDLKDLQESADTWFAMLRASINERVTVRADTTLKKLHAAPAKPTYDRILPVCPRCKGDGNVGGEGCEWCGEKGYLPPELYPLSHQDFVGAIAWPDVDAA